MNKKAMLDKAMGSLTGVAIGDAMGMPTTLYTPKQISKKFGVVKDFLPAPVGHLIHNGMKAGQVTDDTEITMVVADMIISDEPITSEIMAKKLIDWVTDRNLWDTEYLGPSTAKALKAIRGGAHVRKAGKMGTTNGASMRISPVGLLNAGNMNGAIRDAVEISLPTHGSNIAIAGACACACAIAEGMKPNSDVNSVIQASLKGARRGSKKGFPMPLAPVDKRIELALEFVRKAENFEEVASNLYNYIGCGLETNEAVPTSIALFAAHEGDPMKAITAAVNLGGDADTIASITGGICGALKGIKAFPRDKIEKVEKVNNLKIREIARDLVEKCKVPP